MYVREWWIVSAPTRGLFLCLFPSLLRNSGNEHKNNTRVSAETVRHESTYIILFLTRHNESINDAKTKIFSRNPRVSLARITFCWWRHNRSAMASQWPDNCDANTWQVISNSLDIDFIHGAIHGRSCKKNRSSIRHIFITDWSQHKQPNSSSFSLPQKVKLKQYAFNVMKAFVSKCHLLNNTVFYFGLNIVKDLIHGPAQCFYFSKAVNSGTKLSKVSIPAGSNTGPLNKLSLSLIGRHVACSRIHIQNNFLEWNIVICWSNLRLQVTITRNGFIL